MAADRYTFTGSVLDAARAVHVDEDEHPIEDLLTLVTALWIKGDLDGPSMPALYLTHDYDIVAAAEVPGTPLAATVATDQYEWPELTGRDDERRNSDDLAHAVRALVEGLNAALDAFDAFSDRQREDVEFAKIAAAFDDPTGIDDMVFTPLAAHVALTGDVLLGLLASVENGTGDEPDDGDETDAPWVGLQIRPEQVEAYLESLGDDDEEDTLLGDHLRATAAQLSITRQMLEDFAVNEDIDSRVVLSTVGHLLDVATTLDAVAHEHVTAETVTVLYDRVASGRTFRLASHVRVGDAGATLVTDRLPTAILTASSAPSTALHLVHALEVAVAALDSTLEDLRDHLTQRFVLADLDGRDEAPLAA